MNAIMAARFTDYFVGTHFTLGKQILLVLSHTFEQKAKDKLEQ
jgi:hypothetical protein